METIQKFQSVTDEINDIDLVTLQIKRTVKGTRVYIKSKIFEDFFSTFGDSGEQFRDADDNIRELYKMPNMERVATYYMLREPYVNTLIGSENYTNMAFLRSKQLSKGICFKIDGLQSKTSIKKFSKNFKANAIDIYNEYLKDEKREVEIKIRESK